MESKWGYELTQKAAADLDDIVGYIAVGLANPTAASDFVNKLQGGDRGSTVFSRERFFRHQRTCTKCGDQKETGRQLYDVLSAGF